MATGSHTACVSDGGAFDMIGNLGEWVADWDEVAADCQNWPSGFGDDITCLGRGEGDANNHFPGALIRGVGFPGVFGLSGGTDAGVFAVIANDRPSDPDGFIGFRGAR